METLIRTGRYDWAVSSVIHKGEKVSGDRFVISEFDDGILVALIDALGHGDQAAYAADIAERVLYAHSNESPVSLIERCHMSMRATRGATISIASFDLNHFLMSWLGIGNVLGVVRTESAVNDAAFTSLLVRSGVVGDQLPELKQSILPVSNSTMLIMATDGIRADFTEQLSFALDPDSQSRLIMGNYSRDDDDATVLVFHYHGD